MAIIRRRRSRNPKGGGSGIARVLPWLAIGGLLYLMAQNAGKVSGKAAAAPSSSAAGCAGGVTNDFGTAAGCWCGS